MRVEYTELERECENRERSLCVDAIATKLEYKGAAKNHLRIYPTFRLRFRTLLERSRRSLPHFFMQSC